MNPYEIVDKYYPENTQQRQILVIHSLAVSGKAMNTNEEEIILKCLLPEKLIPSALYIK